MVNKDKVDNRYNNEVKNMVILSLLKKLTKVDYLISGAKKTFNL